MRNVRAKATKAILDCVGQDMTPILEILWELQDGTGQTRKSGHFLDDGNGNSSKTPLEWAVETVRAAGFTGNDITLLDGCDCSKLLPNEVMLVLEQDPKNEKYERVKYVNRLGGGTLEAKNSPKGQALAELKMRFKAASAATATAATKAMEPEYSSEDFDEDEFENM